MELIPAIDLLGGQVVRLLQGDYDRVTRYPSDPVDAAARWVEQGATRLHLVDLDGAREGRPVQAEVVARIVASVPVPCQVAGGLRDAGTAGAVLAMGADRVVLGSALLRDPGLGRTLVDRYGEARIAAAIDVRDGQALGDGWVPGTRGRPAMDAVAELAEAGVAWFAVTAIARDGLLGGPDLDLLAAAQVAARGGHVIASGGVHTLGDVIALRTMGMAAAILGRALYEGQLDLPTALAVASAGAS